MIKLRRFYEPDALRQMYAHQYSVLKWTEHQARVARTLDLARPLIAEQQLETLADLSWGDRSIANGLSDLIVAKHLNDITTGVPIDVALTSVDAVDLFICTETIEHLEAPWTTLEAIALKTKWLLLSTPLDEPAATPNWEHYWSFSANDVGSMLTQAGFDRLRCVAFTEPDWEYVYQVWVGRSVYV